MTSSPRSRTPPPHRWSWMILLLGCALAVALPAVLQINPTTTSAPAGVYRVTHQPHRRGSLVRACLPETLAVFGRSRGYLEAGPCPGGSKPVGKWIVALPGDVVEVAGEEVRVNGQALREVRRFPRDRAGRFIPAVPEGTYPVSAGTAWLISAFHSASWDSRYYGAVPLGPRAPVLEPFLMEDLDLARPPGAGGP